jgi:hypothetical protein
MIYQWCRPSLLFGLLIIFPMGPAVAAPMLEETRLYSNSTSGCRSIALDHWSHPTAEVLKKADVAPNKVELCNQGKYPIFTVRFKYDPRGRTSTYFNPLYARMASANGFWPFSFVDLDDSVINVGIGSAHELSISYEDYAASPASHSESSSPR